MFALRKLPQNLDNLGYVRTGKLTCSSTNVELDVIQRRR